MKKHLPLVAALIVLVFFTINTGAQNLVNDPGFESATSCTDDFNITPNWDDAGGGGPGDTCATPDIFTPCGTPLISLIFGSHTPHGGSNYAGAFVYVAQNLGCIPLPTGNGREYIQGSLSQPLNAGQKYTVKFYMALSTMSPWASTSIGVYFSNTHVVHNYCPGTGTNGTLLPFTPQLTWCGTTIMDTLGWTELKWTYIATGGEQYFVVGNFNDDANTNPVCVKPSAFFPMMYYFYDDFSVTTCDPDTATFSNITTGGCSGGGTASATANFVIGCGGATPTYTWSNGTNGQTISGVSSGTYIVTVSDAIGCSATSSVNLSGGTSVVLAPVTTSATCGSSNGSATARVSSGTGPFSYRWSNSDTSQTISNVAATIYTVTVTGSGGCSASASATVSSTGTVPTLVPHSTPSNCGASTGSASISAGTGSFSYLWNDSSNSSSINNVSGGTYTVTVTAVGGCSASASVTVAQTGGLTLSSHTTPTTCGGNNGSAEASVTVGAGPYTYLWSNTLTSDTITGIAAGSYNVTVTGAGGCSASTSVSVGSSTGLGLATQPSATTCGSNNGSASVNITAGAAPFTFRWNNSDSTQSISNLAAGTYIVTVTGSGNCSATASATIGASTGASISTNTTNSGCTSTGTATVNILAGSAPFVYHWSNSDSSSTISGLSAGNYTVTVTASGCSASATAVVGTSGGGVALVASATGANCGASNGIAYVTITAGTPPYTFHWSNLATSDTITSLGGGVYTVTVTGTGGCTATASANVASTTGVTLASPTTTRSGCGISNGTAIVLVATGTAPYVYNWSNSQHTDTITGLAGGTYTVTVTGAGGCSATASALVPSTGTDSVTITTDKTIMCAGDSAHICAPAGFVSYNWNGGLTTPCIYVRQAGNYYVSGIDTNNCTYNSNRLFVGVHPQPPVLFSVNGDTLTAYNAISYQWYLNGSPLSGATTHTIIANQSGNYSVAVTDSNGCLTFSNSTKVLLGIQNLSNAGEVIVYPNPLAQGSWQVTVTDEWLGSQCEIFDAEGRIVYKSEIRDRHSQIEMNVAGGVYLMRVYSQKNSANFKLIKL